MSAPVTPGQGDRYYDASTGVWWIYLDGDWGVDVAGQEGP